MRLYIKAGRRYVEWGDVQRYNADEDMMRAGTWRMTFCPRNGEHRYRYDVTPDTASFVAAAELARDAMERAITEMAKAKPQVGVTPYTKKQQKALAMAREILAEAGVMWPAYWEHASASAIAEAGIRAVREHAASA